MRFCIAALVCMLGATRAFAYSDTTGFARDPSADSAGGGGGLYFTGSPRQHGLDCSACHIDGPTDTALRLSALLDGKESTLFQGGYEPGRIYEVEVAFDGDRLQPSVPCEQHPDEPCDLNSFALEIDDGEGKRAGALCPIAPRAGEATDCDRCGTLRARGTLVEADCSVVLSDGFDETAMRFRDGVIAYSFFWTAPKEDVGPIFLYVSAVDGRGRETPDGEATSYQHDGVVTVRVPLDSPSKKFEEPAPSCATSSGATFRGEGWILLLLLFLWRVSKSKRDAQRPAEIFPRAR